MKLSVDSVKRLLDNKQEVLIYGLQTCDYLGVRCYLDAIGYKTYCWYKLPFEHIQSKSDSSTECFKSGITNLILENFKRSKEGQSIIPLIFCVGLEDATKKVVLNVNKVAQSHGQNEGCITDSELRRCYKMYVEMNNDLREIANQTFKFVTLNQNPDAVDEYNLKLVKPFWQANVWAALWQERMFARVATQPKQWRKDVEQFVAGFSLTIPEAFQF